MLRKVILQELMKLDVLSALKELVESARLHLEQDDKIACMTEISKLEEYVESFQDLALIHSLSEQHAMEQGLETIDIQDQDTQK